VTASESDVRRARRIGGISALTAGLLFAVGNALWAFEMPEGGTSGPELVAFFDDNATGIIVGGTLSLLAVAVFLLSAAAIRRVMIDAEGDDILATTALGGAILGVALGASAEGINMLGAIRAQDGELAQSLFEIPQFFGSAGSGLGFAVFSLAFAAVAWRSGRIVPRYAVVLIAIVGLVLLSPLAFQPEVPGGCFIFLALTFGVQLLRPPPHPSDVSG
jgi:hypothetical protein